MKRSHVFQTSAKALLLMGSQKLVLEGRDTRVKALQSKEDFRFLICNFHIVNIIMARQLEIY